MATWADVVRILSFVFDRMVDPKKGFRWLEQAKLTVHGQRLAVSLAIDVGSEALDSSLAARHFDLLPEAVADAERGFSSIQDRSCGFASTFSASSPEGSHPYMRILEFGAFIFYYLQGGAGTLDEVSVEDARIKYLDRPDGCPLGQITEWWSGSRDTVWITSSADVQSVQSQHTGPDFALALMDALGLTCPHGVGTNGDFDLVSVTYPLASPIRCWQPTTFDSAWTGPGFYISHGKDDNWGRTQSCSGERPCMKERIHKKFEGLTDDFLLRPVGQTGKPPADERKLLDNAYQRLGNVLKTGTTLDGGQP